MRVDVHGRIKVSVAQPFLYLFRMPVLGGQQGGRGMPERTLDNLMQNSIIQRRIDNEFLTPHSTHSQPGMLLLVKNFFEYGTALYVV